MLPDYQSFALLERDTGVEGTGAFAVEFWIKVPSASGIGSTVPLFQGNENGDGWQFRWGADFKPQFQIRVGGVVRSTPLTTPAINDGLWHHVFMQRRSSDGNLELWFDFTQYVSVSSASTFSIPAGLLRMGPQFANQPIHFYKVSLYNRSFSSTEISEHYGARNAWLGDTAGERINRLLDKIGWPAGQRNIENGISLLPSVAEVGNIKDHFDRVTEAESGAWFFQPDGKLKFRGRSALYLHDWHRLPQVTFGRNAGEYPYHEIRPSSVARRIYNRIRYQRVGGVEQIAQDYASPYMLRERSKTDLLNSSDGEVADKANFDLTRYKNASVHFDSLVLNHAVDSINLQHWMDRKLEDRIRVKRTGNRTTQEAFIQSIEHQIDRRKKWKTTFGLSPIDTDISFWIVGGVGRSEVGVSTRVAY